MTPVPHTYPYGRLQHVLYQVINTMVHVSTSTNLVALFSNKMHF